MASSADSAFRLTAAGPRRELPIRASVVASLCVVVGVACTVAWWLTGHGTYWPVWAWIGMAGGAGAVAVIEAAWPVPAARTRWNALHVGLAGVASMVVILVWLRVGGGEWIGWTLLGIAVAVCTHTILTFSDRLPQAPREMRLTARVEELTASRHSALDAELVQLRRIERDLHDGAQSRLVALNVLLGRAEAQLEGESRAAELVGEARREAVAAIGELRSLARGMSPPLLDERGLGPALEALALRSPMNVRLDVDLAERPPRPVEAGAYFVVSEALTNAAKHADTDQASVRLSLSDERLVVTITDSGCGGADSGGAGLAGLRQRVMALDGTLTVEPGEACGTSIRAEIPCA